MKKLSKVLALVMCLVMMMGVCSSLFINAYAASAPAFSLEETSKNGNTVTYELKLKNGGFNALDFNFVMSKGVTCTSIKYADGVNGGIANPKTGKTSFASTETYSKAGTIITATFTVPSDSYTISGDIENCAISGADGLTDVTNSVKLDGASQSWFAKIIAAIVSFFQMIINFFKGLFA